MKKILPVFLTLFLILTSVTAFAVPEISGTGSKILVVYYTAPTRVEGDPKTADIDVLATASRIVDKSGLLGTLQFMARIIQKQTGADLWRIETVKAYPDDNDRIHTQARYELHRGVRPKLKEKIPDLDNYDTVFLGFPLWWYDLPVPVYSFLEENDLRGKTVIPFLSHAGSGPVHTTANLQKAQPEAKVSRQGLALHRNDVPGGRQKILNWLKKLGY